jgi:hypothetical protein
MVALRWFEREKCICINIFTRCNDVVKHSIVNATFRGFSRIEQVYGSDQES